MTIDIEPHEKPQIDAEPQKESLTFEAGAALILDRMTKNPRSCRVYDQMMSVTFANLMKCPSKTEGDRLEKAFEVARELRRIHFPTCKKSNMDRVNAHDFVP